MVLSSLSPSYPQSCRRKLSEERNFYCAYGYGLDQDRQAPGPTKNPHSVIYFVPVILFGTPHLMG